MMARPGVTYHDVANAALEIQGQGKYPTIENVRACLGGTGSSSTIGPHLRQWRLQQDSAGHLAVKENIPEELVSLIKGLWERVVHLADEKVKIIQEESQVVIKQWEAEVTQKQLNFNHLEEQYQLLQQEKLLLSGEREHLHQELRALKENYAALSATRDSVMKQLEENQIRIQELHQLHQQAQANLEHYREAVREQRLLDQRKFEQREQQLELMVKESQGFAKQSEQRLMVLEQQHTQVCNEKLSLTEINENLLKQTEKLKSDLIIIEKKQAESANLLHFTREQYQIEQKKSAEQSEAIGHLKAELALTTQKLSASEKEAVSLDGQKTALSHEKWILLQEKAQLEGQLTQLNKILAREREGDLSEKVS
jgi:hypothetical protein